MSFFCNRAEQGGIHCNHDGWNQCPDCEAEKPCNWEKMSGICMVCGSGPDDECEVEREQRRARR
jgi:hypothetical protein